MLSQYGRAELAERTKIWSSANLSQIKQQPNSTTACSVPCLSTPGFSFIGYTNNPRSTTSSQNDNTRPTHQRKTRDQKKECIRTHCSQHKLPKHWNPASWALRYTDTKRQRTTMHKKKEKRCQQCSLPWLQSLRG